MRRSIRAGFQAALVLVAVEVIAGGPSFTKTWKAPEAAGVTFFGKKVAALVISTDESLRHSGEEQLVRELAGRGIQSIATYRMMPREEAATADRAKPWFERAGVEGVVALRPVSVEKETYAGGWTSESYSTFWNYYGYGYGAAAVYTFGGARSDTHIVVETLVYSLPLDKLLWAGVSTTTNPREVQAFVKELVGAAVKEMKKQKLVK